MKYTHNYSRSVLFLILTVCILSYLNLSASINDSFKLRYKMKKGATLLYSATTKIESLQEMMGSEQMSEIESKVRAKLTSEGSNEDGNLPFLMVYDSLVFDIQSLMDYMVENPPGVIGKRIRKTIAPNGDQIQSTELDQFQLGVLAQFGFSTGEEFLPNLPKNEIRIGETVSTTDTDSTRSSSQTVITKIDFEYTLVGKEFKSGYNCVKMGVIGRFTLEGEGTTQGMKYSLEGKGNIQSTIYFAHEEGILVSSESLVNSKMTISMPEQNMTIPNNESSRSTLTLVSGN